MADGTIIAIPPGLAAKLNNRTSLPQPVLRRAPTIPEIPTPMFSRPPSRLLRAETTYTIPKVVPIERAQTVPLGRPRAWTQEDQDLTDADTRKKAMKELVQSWMDRLQLISVITTFFAATEAQMLGITTPSEDDPSQTRIEETANAALAGALVTHVFAAILSFFAAFFLVRYRLNEATRAERKVEAGLAKSQSSGATSHPIFSTNPHLEPIGPFRRGHPPTHLLENCHTLCMWLAAVGFVLALAGVVCFTWALLPGSVSIFASTCMGVCLIGGACAVREARNSSRPGTA
ncbi:hypothetical protein EIP91_000985 [Steccherinum ochraceum]|uniref:Transmembrane protein n=1 Tax=Steccherinum ochraceum TaxID=92696 RepID=A0A4R0RVH4_9APHY|nr:hypothetical protein EIP91_000985 [Steccherinum ochraceum]